MVIPALYLSFAPLKRSFRYKQWADLTFYSKPYDLAEGYVLDKQSGRLSY